MFRGQLHVGLLDGIGISDPIAIYRCFLGYTRLIPSAVLRTYVNGIWALPVHSANL